MDAFIGQLKELLSRPRRIAITTHQKPDADALGSALGLYHYLVAEGHKAKIVSPTEYADFLRWMPGNEEILVGPNDPSVASWTFEGADIIFCLDFNALSRLNEFAKYVKDSEATRVLIDHHLEPEKFEDLTYLDEKASSTAEMVYRVIVALGGEEKISPAIADCLYAGIMTDTGSFRFTNTSPEVHRVAARLMERGADVTRIYDLLFNNASAERLRFMGYCFSNCFFVREEYRMAYFKVGREVFRQFNVRTGDTEGLVNFGLSIKGIDLSVLITAQEDLVKLSFRSRNEFSSNELAQQFNGGGHFYAAGGKSSGTMESVEQQLLSLIAAHYAEKDPA
jgi:phosphoesterase RecJ-like protein